MSAENEMLASLLNRFCDELREVTENNRRNFRKALSEKRYHDAGREIENNRGIRLAVRRLRDACGQSMDTCQHKPALENLMVELQEEDWSINEIK